MEFISDVFIGGSYFLVSNPAEIDAAVSNWSQTLKMAGQFFSLAVVFVFIIFLAVYSLRLASRFRGYAGGSSNLRVVESRSLGGQNFVHIIKVGDRYFAVGSSKENVSLIAEIDAQSITDAYENVSRPAFEQMLAGQIKKLIKREPPDMETGSESAEGKRMPPEE